MSDYHDYVFKNGKFIGDFETMYKESSTIPWHQDEQAMWPDVRLTQIFLEGIAPFEEILDVGCGLGYYLQILKDTVGANKNVKTLGIDISATACKKAKLHFPSSEFFQADLTKSFSAGCTRISVGQLCALRGVLWYVCYQVDEFFKNVKKLCSVGSYFLLVQNFPPERSTYVGKDVFPTHRTLLEKTSRYFDLKKYLWYVDESRGENDNWLIALFKKTSE